VHDALTRIGGAGAFEMRPILPSERTTAYRNRLDFAACNKKWLSREDYDARKGWKEAALGFHLPGLFDKVLDIEDCRLQDDASNRIRNALKKYAWEAGLAFYDYRRHTGYLRSLVLRNTLRGEWMAVVIFAYDDERKAKPLLDFLAASFPEIASLVYVINGKKNDTWYDLDVRLHGGAPFLTETLGGLSFRISPKSFFQTNTRQAEVLYRTALDMAGLAGAETVYDLYTGTGTIACYVARHCKTVLGIDHTPDAIADARINAAHNGIGNADFLAGDPGDLLAGDALSAHGRPDVIITDPPRAGMSEKAVNALLASDARRIVYVSCNPATQARDLRLLAARYRLVRAQPVDLFPHTQHVENVALLERREGPSGD
jgi:23S rRNA (uracil1939-C5)-methyltransferase